MKNYYILGHRKLFIASAMDVNAFSPHLFSGKLSKLLPPDSDFKVKKAPNSISAGAMPKTPLGELAALHIQLPRHPADPSPLSALRA